MILKKGQIHSKIGKETSHRVIPHISLTIYVICVTTLFLASPAMADENISQNVTIDQIGNHAVGETFDISGFCLDKDPSIFVMIHPTKDYTEIKKWVLEANDPQYSFGIECDGTEEGSPGNITRFFQNGTSESKIVPMPLNRIYPSASTMPESDGSSWKITINGTNFLGDPLKPDTYSITVLAVGKDNDPFYGAADDTFTLT